MVKKNKTHKIYIIILAMVMLVGLLALLITNTEIKEKITNLFTGNAMNLKEAVQVFDDGSAILTDDSAIVSSVAIVNKITGTGPFDENDEAGNDSSADNNIVRSFDTVTWEIEANMAVNNTEYGSDEADIYSKFRGGIINVEATLPEENVGTMKWSLEDMTWA